MKRIKKLGNIVIHGISLTRVLSKSEQGRLMELFEDYEITMCIYPDDLTIFSIYQNDDDTSTIAEMLSCVDDLSAYRLSVSYKADGKDHFVVL